VTRSGIVTLTTDFGYRDAYVASMKGVILGIHRQAALVDVSHGIRAGAIQEAANLLCETVPYFPEGTVHLAVVDPGVGGDRRAIAAEANGHLFVGPDNGVFWPLLQEDPNRVVVHLTESRFFHPPVSRTFHGRDVFAPVAAHLASGRGTGEMGSPVLNPVVLECPRPEQKEGVLVGEIVRVDRFGNLITNLRRSDVEAFRGDREPRIEVDDVVVEGLKGCYADVPRGEILALFGSSDRLEISVNGGKASERLGTPEARLEGLPVRVVLVD
jgi:S-adenosyl-L-methionine hydrolase (adenosine-forming)